MPAPTHETLRRYLEILKILDVTTGMSGEQVNARLQRVGLDRHARTLQRDLDWLHSQGFLQQDASAKPYTYTVAKGATNRLPGVSLSEALSLQLLKGALTHLLPDALLGGLQARFALADQKLKEQARNRGLRTPYHQKVALVPKHLQLMAPPVQPGVVVAVQQALFEEWQLKVLYQSLTDAAPKERLLHPRAMIHRDGVTYLLATRDPNHKDVRQYALHRMTHAECVAKRTSASDFSLEKHVESQDYEVGGGKVVAFEALISQRLANVLRDTPLTPTMSMVPVGNQMKISAEVRWTLALERWVLGHAADMEVVGPAALRARIQDLLGRAAGQYERRRRSPRHTK